MNEILLNLVMILIIIFSLFLRFFLSYKTSKVKGIKYFKLKLKEFIYIILFLIIGFIIYNFLPKYETEIDINIKNNYEMVEININKDFYKIFKNEINLNINKQIGFIAVKTEYKNKIVYYNNKKSIFPYNRRIKININNENIKINSFFIELSPFIENHKNYDNILEILIK